jgi:hypothetical protein
MNPKWCDTNRDTSISSTFSPALWFLIQLHLHESTPLIMSTVHKYILWLCWGLLTLCHEDLKNPVHDMLFPTVEVMEKHLSSISFAAGLLEVLLSPLPPMIDWIKSLPTQNRGLWDVYHCSVCDASFVSASALQKHENGPKHIQRMFEAGL